jgi:hypothetical protein
LADIVGRSSYPINEDMMMKTMNTSRKQRGFFSVGIGIALFAIFGTLGLGITASEPKGNEIASTQQSETVALTAYKDE